MANPDPLASPPAATPSSPLDNEEVPSYWSSQHHFSSSPVKNPQSHGQPRTHSNSVPQSNTRPYPVDERAETASIASSVLPSYSTATRYGIYDNEQAYLAALRAWAEEKQWVRVADGETEIHGVYGDECLEHRSRRMTAERKADKEAKAREKARKASLAGQQRRESAQQRSSISQWLSRRRQSGAI